MNTFSTRTEFLDQLTMLSKFLSATRRTNEKRRSESIKRRQLRPEQLEDRRLLAVFQGLGDLSGGDFFSYAHHVSDDGQVVVGESSTDAGPQPFRWSATEGLVMLDTVGDPNGVARAVSGDGGITAGYTHPEGAPGDPAHAVLWENGQTSTIAGQGSSALAMTPNAQFVAGAQEGSSGEKVGYVWEAATGQITSLGQLASGRSTVPRGISDDGAIIAGYSYGGFDDVRYAFRWDSNTGLQPIVESAGAGVDISGDGTTIVGTTRIIDKLRGNGSILKFHYEAFRWSETSGSPKIEYLGDLPGGGEYSAAEAVSHDGSVIVGSSESSVGIEPFVWDVNNGMRSLQEVLVNEYGLDLTGWQLRDVQDVTADGTTFVGYGINPDGKNEAFIASLGPSAPGISVSPTSTSETTEGGGTASFEVVLDTQPQPTTDVTISISSNDTTEGIVDTNSLTFTVGNWDVPQIVVVTGVDDAEVDGDITYSVITASAVSTDPNYSGLDAADVSFVNKDDDGSSVPDTIYIGSIDFESRRGGNDWRAVFTVYIDFNMNGIADPDDISASGADLTVTFNGQTFPGSAGSDGIYRTPWQKKLGSGQYEAEVVHLALTDLTPTEYVWDRLTGEDDSDDEDDYPDAILLIG